LPHKQGKRGRPRIWPLREILNAIFYVVRSGCAWRLMPHDLPPWQTAYGYYWQWRNDGIWDKINTALVPAVGNGGKLTLQQLFERIKCSVYSRCCRLQLIWADGGHEDIVDWVKQHLGWTLEIVRRPKDAKGFVVLPRRWVVERTFGWLGRYRRLSKDFEHQPRSSEAMVYAASIHRMLRLLAAPAPP
jgi:transposase